jgi:hypothetical protein
MIELSAQKRVRLVRLLSMFSSNFDGEVTAAARAAQRLVKELDATWDDVVGTRTGQTNGHRSSAPHSPQKRQDPSPRSHSSKQSGNAPSHIADIEVCLAKRQFMTAWEIQFVNDLRTRSSLTGKQRARLDVILEKLKGYEGMNW